ncbi:MAG: zinc ABC transporter substrate-binding protein [Betaproteobacteria bacterium]|nr:zinc ABC transporter substrate-binding protein [Betaproteobacteria bacterium]
MRASRRILALFLFLLVARGAQAAPIAVVAAESTYGEIAQAIGGPYVAVRSIIASPRIDPHLFEAMPSVAVAVARAQVVVMNGLGYDAWMQKLLLASPNPRRQVVVAADLASNLIMSDRNPHVFYDLRVALITAARLAAVFAGLDPAHAAQFRANLAAFSQQLLPVYGQIEAIIAAHPNLAVTGTEPVFGYMLRTLGYRAVNRRVQQNVMNDTQPSPQEVVAFERSLRTHAVGLFVYNAQVQSPLTQRLTALAREAHIPVVGVAEFAPPGLPYPQWQLATLRLLAAALNGVRP